jgi:hypothetical protein
MQGELLRNGKEVAAVRLKSNIATFDQLSPVPLELTCALTGKATPQVYLQAARTSDRLLSGFKHGTELRLR